MGPRIAGVVFTREERPATVGGGSNKALALDTVRADGAVGGHRGTLASEVHHVVHRVIDAESAPEGRHAPTLRAVVSMYRFTKRTAKRTVTTYFWISLTWKSNFESAAKPLHCSALPDAQDSNRQQGAPATTQPLSSPPNHNRPTTQSDTCDTMGDNALQVMVDNMHQQQKVIDGMAAELKQTRARLNELAGGDQGDSVQGQAAALANLRKCRRHVAKLARTCVAALAGAEDEDNMDDLPPQYDYTRRHDDEVNSQFNEATVRHVHTMLDEKLASDDNTLKMLKTAESYSGCTRRSLIKQVYAQVMREERRKNKRDAQQAADCKMQNTIRSAKKRLVARVKSGCGRAAREKGYSEEERTQMSTLFTVRYFPEIAVVVDRLGQSVYELREPPWYSEDASRWLGHAVAAAPMSTDAYNLTVGDNSTLRKYRYPPSATPDWMVVPDYEPAADTDDEGQNAGEGNDN